MKVVIKEGQRVGVVGDPWHFEALVAPLPEGARLVRNPRTACRTLVVCTPTAKGLRAVLPRVLAMFPADGSVWISWPKKSSPLFVDLAEDTVRSVAPPQGVVDTRVCAIDEDGSGLRLMVRKENRPSWNAKTPR